MLWLWENILKIVKQASYIATSIDSSLYEANKYMYVTIYDIQVQ